MKKLISSCNHNFILSSAILFISVIFFTLDSFCYDTITTAFDIINIGGIRLEAMDFVYILFSLTFTIGMAIGFTLKKFSKKYTSIMSLLGGILLLIIAFLDVNLFQSLVPTMRISHVIMTLSQITIIIFGASGLMIGSMVSHVIVINQPIKLAYPIISFCIGMALSIFAVSEKLYNLIYGILALFIILGTIVFQYNNTNSVLSTSSFKLDKRDLWGLGGNVACISAMCLIFGTMYNYLINTVAMSIFGYITIMATAMTVFVLGKSYKTNNVLKVIVWSITAILTIVACLVPTPVIACLTLLLLGYSLGTCWVKQDYKFVSSLAYGEAFIIFSIISLVIIKSLSQEIKHSNNRIYYKVDATVFAIILSLMIISALLHLLHTYFQRKKATISTASTSNSNE